MRISARLALSMMIGLVGAACRPTSAADVAPDRPYDLHVVVYFGKQRGITDEFRRGIRSELETHLRAALGVLAKVEVVDYQATTPQDRLPLWSEVEARGFGVLDGMTALSRYKAHFVRIDFHDGQYSVQCRQHDGLTGLASPVVRRAGTADRAFVARTILSEIARDFGAVGRVIPTASDAVRIQFHGGAMPGADLSPWVNPGDVFALVRMSGSDRPTGERVNSALLVVREPVRDGTCPAQLFSRYLNPMKVDAEYRAIRLGATSGPIRLKFVNEQGAPHASLQLRVSPTGFFATDAVRDQGITRDGIFETASAYDRIAFVRVFSGERLLAQVPVEVLSNQVVSVTVRTVAGGDELSNLESDARACRRRLEEILSRLIENNRQLRDLLTETKNQMALTRVRTTAAMVEAELPRQVAELARLRDAASKRSGVKLPLEESDRIVRTIEDRAKSLRGLAGELEKAVQAAASPEADQQRKEFLALLRRAEREYEDADFDKAIATYKKALTTAGDWPEIRKRLEELETAWRVKDDAHKEARRVIFEDVPRLNEPEAIRNSLSAIHAALDTCRRANDRLTPRKLYLELIRVAILLARRDEELRKGDAEENRKQLEALAAVSVSVQSLFAEVEKVIRSKD